MIRYILFICLFSYQLAAAQQVRPAASTEIYNQIKMLKTVPRVLYFAAHPDDENTGLLAWLTGHEQVKTAYLSLTRGDGGQNLIGSEQGAGLGLIRTYELLEARKKDGALQFFTRAVDFGFSKNPEDTFSQWPEQDVLGDAVWVIRNFKPDIIICRFPPTAAAGHGQHSASAIIAEKAFKAAADPSAYPEQLTKTEPWQAKRLLWNTFRFGSTNTTAPDQFKITTGQYNPLSGLSYGELAGISRSLHQSQGAGTPSIAGVNTEYFSHVAGDPIKENLFDGIPKNLAEAGFIKIDQQIGRILNAFDFTAPQESLPELLNLRRQMLEEKASEQIAGKLEDLDAIILKSAGFMAELITSVSEATAGETLDFELNLIARSGLPFTVSEIEVLGSRKPLTQRLEKDSLYRFSQRIDLPEQTSVSEPYWLSEPPESPFLYTVKNQNEIGQPVLPPALQARLRLSIDGQPLEVSLPLSFKKLDPIKGDVVEPLRIVPKVSLGFSQGLFFQKAAGEKTTLSVTLYAAGKDTQGELEVYAGEQRIYRSSTLRLPEKRDTTIRFTLNETALASGQELQAVFKSGSERFDRKRQLISYNHLPVLQYFQPATAKFIGNEIQVSNKKIGYIMGAGDFVPEILEQAGLTVRFLKPSDFNSVDNLLEYDVIIGGVRSLNTEKNMRSWMPLLNEYIFNGGTFIMQFNTLQDLSTNVYGPYPFTISRDRVTQEDAQVTMIQPQHRLLQHPNLIHQTDFDRWVQERGLYFPAQWDERYTTLLQMNDTGEEPLSSAILYTPYGKGHYIYSPLAFFRQLPAGNPGAIKLFFNLISIQQ